MAQLTVQNIVQTGLAPTYAAAAAGGDAFAAGSTRRAFVHIKNASGGSINVTVVRQKTSLTLQGEGPVTLGNLVVAVPATTGDKMIGPFPDSFIDASGNVQLTYSAVTSVTVAAVAMPDLF